MRKGNVKHDYRNIFVNNHTNSYYSMNLLLKLSTQKLTRLCSFPKKRYAVTWYWTSHIQQNLNRVRLPVKFILHIFDVTIYIKLMTV